MSPAARSAPQSQRLPFIILATMGVVGWGLFSAIALPQWGALSELRQRADVSRKRIERLQRLAARKPAIEQAWQAYEEFRGAEPEATLHQSFLDELEQLTQGSDLQLNLKPKPLVEDEQTFRAPVELEIDATQASLFDFLDRLLSWPRLIEIDRLTITSSPSRDYPLRASIVVSRVVLRPRPAAHHKGG